MLIHAIPCEHNVTSISTATFEDQIKLFIIYNADVYDFAYKEGDV